MTTFVLVHGAFRGGWAWRFVREQLVAAGHEVHTPSLTGMGDRAHLRGPDQRIALDTWVADLDAVVRSEDLRDVVLVGHSQGGMVLAAAASRFADRVRELVYLDAPVPRDGERGIDLNPPGVPSPRVEDVDLAAALPPRPVGDPDGFAPDLAAWVNERLCATPIGPSFDRAEVTAEVAALPARYVFFSDTPTTYPCWTTRARLDAEGADYTVVTGGHDAPLTAPDAVVKVLLEG